LEICNLQFAIASVFQLLLSWMPGRREAAEIEEETIADCRFPIAN
jgi:hypothetical protein